MESSLEGKVLRNHFKIEKTLGSGGFGDTYLAIDLDLPDHPKRVVKHLLPKQLEPSALPDIKRLFNLEADCLYRLGKEHDQIPQLYAHFEEQGQFYLVQEFINGHDLTEELPIGQRQTEAATIQLLQEILSVLSYVHQKNVIHRDIKPQNIMRRFDDGKLVLIDFGAVKELNVMSVDAKGDTLLTMGIGSPGFMPSEQAGGKPKLCSDVYAVGMLGIQCLTGVVPASLQEDPQTGDVLWRGLAPVSDPVAEVLNKMVKDHFSQRYSTAMEALTALQDAVSQSQVQYHPAQLSQPKVQQPPAQFPQTQPQVITPSPLTSEPQSQSRIENSQSPALSLSPTASIPKKSELTTQKKRRLVILGLLVGLGCLTPGFFGVFQSINSPSLNSPSQDSPGQLFKAEEAEAKSVLDQIFIAQKSYGAENDKLALDFSELELDFSELDLEFADFDDGSIESNDYEFKVIQYRRGNAYKNTSDPFKRKYYSVSTIAHPKEGKLKSFLSIIVMDSQNYTLVLCVSDSTANPWPELPEELKSLSELMECPSGFSAIE